MPGQSGSERMVTSDSLEENLSCDDLYLEYFNSFLSLPAFPSALCYSRFTGTFHDLEKENVPVAPICDVNPANQMGLEGNGVKNEQVMPGSVYGAKEDERERMMSWARDNRLPLFLETQRYRELKLCKLLLRPVDLRRGSSRIRGYSRLSGYGTTTSAMSGVMEMTSRATTSIGESTDWVEGVDTKAPGFGSSRPGSRAVSLPINIGTDHSTSSATLQDTSASETSHPIQQTIEIRPRTHHRRRQPFLTSSAADGDSSRQNPYSDSGLGTTAFGYSQSGPSDKTRNIATRADTLGVSSFWESEEGASRSRSAMTSPTVQESPPASATKWMDASKYEGKSALRTADSPTKPHRATIVLPKSASQPTTDGAPLSQTDFETTTVTTSNAYDDDITYDVDDVIEDVEFDPGEFLNFDDQDSSIEETETEIASIEIAHCLSLQHIKEKMFKSKSGMDNFLSFLVGTAGESLAKFWLDSEAFKDTFSNYEMKYNSGSATLPLGVTQEDDEAVMRLQRHQLYRDVLDRHKFVLTEKAKQQIREAQENEGLCYHVFTCAQYDVLRRLRSYWLPRYIIHQTSADGSKLDIDGWDCINKIISVSSRIHISVLSLLPLQRVRAPEDDNTGTEKHEPTIQTLESVTAKTEVNPTRPSTSQIRQMSARSASTHISLRALNSDSEAGFPLRQYTLRHETKEISNVYDFLSTLEYLAEMSDLTNNSNVKSSKPTTVQCGAVEAYAVVHAFLLKDSSHFIPMPRKLKSSINQIQQTLKRLTSPGKRSNATTSFALFRPIEQHAMTVLASCVERYKKYETRNFIRAKEGISDEETDTKAKPPSPPVEPVIKNVDDGCSTLSETTTGVSRPWFTDDTSTSETDSASTMYSYDMERIRQLAVSIRKKGAKVNPKAAQKKQAAKKGFVRRKTAVPGHQASKVQFILPTSQDGSEKDEISVNKEDAESGKKKKHKAAKNQHPNRMTFSEIKSNKLLNTFMKKFVNQCESVDVQNVLHMYELCEALISIPATEVSRTSVLSAELVRTYLHPTGPKQVAMPSERSAQLFSELPQPSEHAIREIQDYVIPTLDQAAANFSLGFNTLLKEYKLDIRSDLGQHMNTAELALRTLTLKPSSKRRRTLGKHSARQTPTSDHKISFLNSLAKSKEGDMPIELLHFYKYLQAFGVQEGYPLIQNDLRFYIEVLKFLASFHDDYDLITLKRKVMSIRDCFIDSQMSPTLQIDIKTGTAERFRRAADAFCSDKGRDPHSPTLFDDAQHTVFNELLPFWAGFVTAMSPSEREGKPPILKSERMHKRRLETFLKSTGPKIEFDIPGSQPKFDMKGIEFTFSVNTGVQWKAWSEASSSRSSTPPLTGVIEVVKAPPISQRRIVRRSGFTIRKLRTSRAEETSVDEKHKRSIKPVVSSSKNNATEMKHGHPMPVVNYTTSVC